jgi:hypothetical protein
MKKDEEDTTRELLGLTMSFDNLTMSYKLNFTSIKQKLALLKCATSRGTVSGPAASRGLLGSYWGVRWDNLNLDSPDVGSTTDDQLTGLQSRIKFFLNDMNPSGVNQSDQVIAQMREELTTRSRLSRKD